MSSWIPILTGIAGAIVGAGGLFLSGWRQSRETLDARVERAVKGQVGDRFMDFLDVGERTAAEVTELTTRAREQAGALIEEAQSRLDQLKQGAETQNELNSLLARAENIFPNLNSLAAATPAALLRDLEAEKTDLVQAAALAARLRDTDNATSGQLETAGDVARDRLGDHALARELYNRSVELNPSNASAQAELLGLDLIAGDAAAVEKAMRGLRKLAIEHPLVRTALIKLLNQYVRNDQYKEMEAEIRKLLESFPDDPLLLRNLALARTHNESQHEEEAAEAYERALEISDQLDAEGDYVNTAKPYVSWLARRGRYDRAEEVLREAWKRMPQEESLYFASFKLEMARGDFQRARRSLEAAARLGGLQEQIMARQYISGLDGLDYLEGRSDSFEEAQPIDLGLLRQLLDASQGQEGEFNLDDQDPGSG